MIGLDTNVLVRYRSVITGLQASLIRWLAAGMTEQEILADYPELVSEDIPTLLPGIAGGSGGSRRAG